MVRCAYKVLDTAVDLSGQDFRATAMFAKSELRRWRGVAINYDGMFSSSLVSCFSTDVDPSGTVTRGLWTPLKPDSVGLGM